MSKEYRKDQTCRYCEDENSILTKQTCCTGCSKLKEQMDEVKRSEITMHFYFPDNEQEFWFAKNGRRMWLLLMEIDEKCRDTIKNGDCEKSAEYAERIREMIRENINLEEVN